MRFQSAFEQSYTKKQCNRTKGGFKYKPVLPHLLTVKMKSLKTRQMFLVSPKLYFARDFCLKT